jgi:Fe/S biogenesis protein NfuA
MDVMSDLLTITDVARTKVLEVRGNEPDPEDLALWLEISGEANGSYTYDMYFRRLDEAADTDTVVATDHFSLVVPGDGAEKLAGATLDFGGAGMVMNNPNHPEVPEAPPGPWIDGTLDSDVARQVLAVLEEQVNPQIAAHGGRADLVSVKDTIAYVRLSGGCQGCAMSTATLREGIEVAILDGVPGIDEVLDVTDHATGENPYYAPADA